jgi:hypothetical protein
MEYPIKSFTLPVPLWVIRGRPTLFDVGNFASSEINSPLKLRPWSECNLSGTPYFINHDDTNIFAVVAAV